MKNTIKQVIKEWLDNKTSWNFTEENATEKWASELTAVITPLLQGIAGWENAPEWAEYKTTLIEWHEKEPRMQNHIAYKHWAGKGKLAAPSIIEQRPR